MGPTSALNFSIKNMLHFPRFSSIFFFWVWEELDRSIIKFYHSAKRTQKGQIIFLQ